MADPVYVTVTSSGVTVTVAPSTPSGGTTGQVLTKNSASDYDVAWVAPQQVGGVPTGGSTGQVLTKNSNTSYDTAWVTPTTDAPIPNTSVTGIGAWRMIVGTDNTAISVPGGGTWAYILFSQKSSNNQVDILGASVVAGNTQVGAGISGAHYHLICWRVA
jgi:hypothetical protein